MSRGAASPASRRMARSVDARGAGSLYSRPSFANHRGPAPLVVTERGESFMETAAAKKLADYRVKNGVAWIELVDPPANTYTHEMMRDLDDAILQARFDESVHVIVLRGAGEKFFCAGANINMLK